MGNSPSSFPNFAVVFADLERFLFQFTKSNASTTFTSINDCVVTGSVQLSAPITCALPLPILACHLQFLNIPQIISNAIDSTFADAAANNASVAMLIPHIKQILTSPAALQTYAVCVQSNSLKADNSVTLYIPNCTLSTNLQEDAQTLSLSHCLYNQIFLILWQDPIIGPLLVGTASAAQSQPQSQPVQRRIVTKSNLKLPKEPTKCAVPGDSNNISTRSVNGTGRNTNIVIVIVLFVLVLLVLYCLHQTASANWRSN